MLVPQFQLCWSSSVTTGGGTLVNLIPPNWNMTHYKSVEFLSIFRMSIPSPRTKPPPQGNVPAVVLRRSCVVLMFVPSSFAHGTGLMWGDTRHVPGEKSCKPDHRTSWCGNQRNNPLAVVDAFGLASNISRDSSNKQQFTANNAYCDVIINWVLCKTPRHSCAVFGLWRSAAFVTWSKWHDFDL